MKGKLIILTTSNFYEKNLKDAASRIIFFSATLQPQNKKKRKEKKWPETFFSLHCGTSIEPTRKLGQLIPAFVGECK